jgi:tRNA threonylcarbamoyladenosine biosynthesis protein TsaB
MALILHIETATRICSVALSNNGSFLCMRESSAPNAHSSQVTLFIDEVLKEAGVPVTAIDAVAVSMGPGSYTGLRIGVAAAKGLCYALDRPLIAVETLAAMATGLNDPTPLPPPIGGEGEYICPMLDAKRMEVYCAIYDRELHEVRPTEAVIVTEDSFAEYLHKGIVTFGGEGAEKCREVLEHHPNARFVSGFETSAKFMVPLAIERFSSGRFEDLAYFEPFYLKEFVAGKPRVKGLR